MMKKTLGQFETHCPSWRNRTELTLSDFSISSWRLKKMSSWFAKTHNFVIGTHRAPFLLLLYATNFNRGELNSKGRRWSSIKIPTAIRFCAKFSVFHILGPSHKN